MSALFAAAACCVTQEVQKWCWQLVVHAVVAVRESQHIPHVGAASSWSVAGVPSSMFVV